MSVISHHQLSSTIRTYRCPSGTFSKHQCLSVAITSFHQPSGPTAALWGPTPPRTPSSSTASSVRTVQSVFLKRNYSCSLHCPPVQESTRRQVKQSARVIWDSWLGRGATSPPPSVRVEAREVVGVWAEEHNGWVTQNLISTCPQPNCCCDMYKPNQPSLGVFKTEIRCPLHYYGFLTPDSKPARGKLVQHCNQVEVYSRCGLAIFLVWTFRQRSFQTPASSFTWARQRQAMLVMSVWPPGRFSWSTRRGTRTSGRYRQSVLLLYVHWICF